MHWIISGCITVTDCCFPIRQKHIIGFLSAQHVCQDSVWLTKTWLTPLMFLCFTNCYFHCDPGSTKCSWMVVFLESITFATGSESDCFQTVAVLGDWIFTKGMQIKWCGEYFWHLSGSGVNLFLFASVWSSSGTPVWWWSETHREAILHQFCLTGISA